MTILISSHILEELSKDRNALWHHSQSRNLL